MSREVSYRIQRYSDIGSGARWGDTAYFPAVDHDYQGTELGAWKALLVYLQVVQTDQMRLRQTITDITEETIHV